MSEETPAAAAAQGAALERSPTKVRIDRAAAKGMSGPAKALLFLISLEEPVATRVIGHLDNEAVEVLRETSAHVSEAPAMAIRAVHREFLDLVLAGLPATLSGSDAYLRRLAGNALGEGRAAEIWEGQPRTESAAALSRLDDGVLEALIEAEQPQTLAVVLSQLPPSKAAALVGRMEPLRRQDVMLRLARLESIPESALRHIEQTFEMQVQTLSEVRRLPIEGKKSAADIVKRLPSEVGEVLLEELRTVSLEAAEAIEKALFVFHDLTRIDARGMQQLLKEVPTDQLVVALKTASSELREKVFGNVSTRAADMIREELELLGPVRLAEVEEAQQTILGIALALERDGKISIAREGGGDYV